MRDSIHVLIVTENTIDTCPDVSSSRPIVKQMCMHGVSKGDRR